MDRPKQKSYYKKLRKPSEQIWPNERVSIKTVAVDDDLLLSIDAFKANLRERFALDRKASQGITAGWLCSVGLKYGGNQAVTIPSNLGSKQTSNLSAEVPDEQWALLKKIQFLHSTPYNKMSIRAVFQAYVRLGLYACSSSSEQSAAE